MIHKLVLLSSNLFVQIFSTATPGGYNCEAEYFPITLASSNADTEVKCLAWDPTEATLFLFASGNGNLIGEDPPVADNRLVISVLESGNAYENLQLV